MTAVVWSLEAMLGHYPADDVRTTSLKRDPFAEMKLTQRGCLDRRTRYHSRRQDEMTSFAVI